MLSSLVSHFSSARRIGTLALIAGLTSVAGLPSAQAIITEFGTGADYVDLIIEADAFGAGALQYRYAFTYDAVNPLDGYDLLKAVDDYFTEITFSLINYGDADAPNYFLNAVTYNSVTLTNTGAPSFSPYWSQWVSGGEAGFPVAEPVEFGTWSFGSGASRPYRELAPFASEGYIFNDGTTAPTTQPVPEPGTVVLLCAGGLLYILARRKSFRFL